MKGSIEQKTWEFIEILQKCPSDGCICIGWTTMYTRKTQPCTPWKHNHVHPENTTMYTLRTQPCTPWEHNHVHPENTTMYTLRTQPCTPWKHNHVHPENTTMYTQKTQPCTPRKHNHVHPENTTKLKGLYGSYLSWTLWYPHSYNKWNQSFL